MAEERSGNLSHSDNQACELDVVRFSLGNKSEQLSTCKPQISSLQFKAPVLVFAKQLLGQHDLVEKKTEKAMQNGMWTCGFRD